MSIVIPEKFKMIKEKKNKDKTVDSIISQYEDLNDSSKSEFLNKLMGLVKNSQPWLLMNNIGNIKEDKE